MAVNFNSASASVAIAKSKSDSKQVVLNALKEVIENPNYDEKLIHAYFSKNYVHRVNGKVYQLQEFMDYLKTTKDQTKAIEIEMVSIVQAGEIVFTNRLVRVISNEDKESMLKVIGEFQVRNGKIYHCDELTHHITEEKD